MRKIFLILLISVSQMAWADSPLTSTSFYVNHENHPMVKEALKKNLANEKILKFLKKSDEDLPTKLAVVCALGWGQNAAQNDSLIFNYFTKGGSYEELTQDEKVVYIYAAALNHYMDVRDIFYLFGNVELANEQRESANLVFNIIYCQLLLDDMNKWCEIYTRTQDLKGFSDIVRDMDTETLNNGIYNYLDIYKDTCNE